MAVSVDIDLGYEFTVKAPSRGLRPAVRRAGLGEPLPQGATSCTTGGGVYRWEMEKVGTAQVNIQTVYASKYVADRKKGTVVWTPVKGVGNALVGGHWKIAKAKKGTAVELKIDGTVEVPLPGLMKMVVVPVVKDQFEGLVDRYIENLVKALGGEVE
jgi:hypothetical protein